MHRKKGKTKAKTPFAPAGRHETIRREIMSVIERHARAAGDISKNVGLSEKEVYEHLYHIRKSIDKQNYVFVIEPAECKKCGFIFKKREKLKKPGKCPLCRSESIKEPLFSINR